MKPSIMFLAAVAAVGCATDDPVEKFLDEGSTSTPSLLEGVHVRSHDCHGALPGEDLQSVTKRGTMHVIGIGQAESTCAVEPCDRDETEPRTASVQVGAGVSTLVLASPLATRWTVTAEPGAQLERVVVTGNDGSSAVVPDFIFLQKRPLGSAFEHYSAQQLAASCEDKLGPDACTDEAFREWWARDRQDKTAETEAFLSTLEDQLNESVGSFRGCHAMSSMSIGSLSALGEHPRR